jgi:hypothetical protein
MSNRLRVSVGRPSAAAASAFDTPFAAKSAGTVTAPVDARRGRRLSPADREKSIADAAVTFFSDHGFEGQTRELAATIGITQPLLYRYFRARRR